MLGHDRLELSVGVCSTSLAETRISDPRVRRHLEALSAWRSLPPDEQRRYFSTGDGWFVPSGDRETGRVRVGLWCPCLGLGGAEAWQLSMARAVDPRQISWSGAVVMEGRASSHEGMVAELSSLMPVGFGSDAARILASASDVIVSWAVCDVAGLLRGLRPPPRIVMACHFPAESPWGDGTLGLLAGVDRLVAVSELAVDSIPSSERDRAQVIWNAVEPDRLKVRRDRSEVRDSWRVPRDALVAGYLGRLASEKDPDAMIRLASCLPEPWHVVLVGEGREHSRLTERAVRMGLTNVHLVGGDRAVGDVLGGFDHLVVPSRYESFGLSMAEGFWSEVPVIATRSGLAKLEPGLARPIPIDGSGPELAEAVLTDHAERVATEARVETARRFARERLSLDRFARDWTELLVNLGNR